MEFSILEFIKLKDLRILCRFAVTENELRSPTVAESSSRGFFYATGGKEGNDSLFIFLPLCMSHRSSIESFQIF